MTVVPMLMHSMMMDVMTPSFMEKNEGKMDKKLSEKVLLEYCSLHHMLLYFADKYPDIIKQANEKVNNFAKSEVGRTKEKIPCLGEFLILLTISNIKWNQIATDFLKELWDRNVKDILNIYPELSNRETITPMTRLQATWKATLATNRMLMFQVFFLKNIGCPDGKSRKEIQTYYNLSCGRPNSKLKHALHQACKEIKSKNGSTFLIASELSVLRQILSQRALKKPFQIPPIKVITELERKYWIDN